MQWVPKRVFSNKVVPLAAAARRKLAAVVTSSGGTVGEKVLRRATSMSCTQAQDAFIDPMAHLVQPVSKKAMEVLQVLVDHGTKMSKKAGGIRDKGAAVDMAIE